MSFYMFTRRTTKKHILFVTNNHTIKYEVEFSVAKYPTHDISETITIFPLLMTVGMYCPSSGMWLSWRRRRSGYLYMRPSSMFCSWGCVYVAENYAHTSPYYRLITGVVVVICRPSLDIYTGTDCFLYIIFCQFYICVIC